MIDVFVSLVLLASSHGPRGDNPEGVSGILIIAGIVLAVAVGALIVHTLFHRFGRSKPRAMKRRPARPGRVGRTSEFRDG